MKNLFAIYHDFMCTGDLNSFVTEIRDAGYNKDIEHINEYVHEYSDDMLMSARLLCSYFERYGFDYEIKDFSGKKRQVYDILRSNKSLDRFQLNCDTIATIAKNLCGDHELPQMHFNSDRIAFDGVLHFTVDNVDNTKEELIFLGLSMYVYGVVIPGDFVMQNILYRYIHSNLTMQATLYQGIGTYDDIEDNWLLRILLCLHNIGKSAAEWCEEFDGVWNEVTHQIPDGFVSIVRPTDKSIVTCVSVLYPGEHFNIGIDVFTKLYNEKYLQTIRFVERSVKVKDSSGNVANRVVNVPVFFGKTDDDSMFGNDDETEHLVSDYIHDFVYNERAIYNIY